VLTHMGVNHERSRRLRTLADIGCAVTIERANDTGEWCIVEHQGRRVIGVGATADAAAADALEQWEADRSM
jgi:hypothetical protein